MGSSDQKHASSSEDEVYSSSSSDDRITEERDTTDSGTLQGIEDEEPYVKHDNEEARGSEEQNPGFSRTKSRTKSLQDGKEVITYNEIRDEIELDDVSTPRWKTSLQIKRARSDAHSAPRRKASFQLRRAGSDAHSTGRKASLQLKRAGSVTKGLLRKGSVAAIGAITAPADQTYEGNPLHLEVDEIGHVIPDLPQSDSFDGRVPEKAGETKQSLHPNVSDIINGYTSNDPGEYTIKRIADHDDIEHMSRIRAIIFRTAPIWGIVALGLYWTYFALRVHYTLAAQRQVHKILPMAWTFIAVELGTATPMMLHRIWPLLTLRGRKRPKLRLVGSSVPSVDVVITCCGEEDRMVFDTAKAACNVDYPSDRFRVIILDDGNSTPLRELVEGNQHKFDNMHYRSRPKYPGVPHHFKAGNLNYGLEETKTMKGGAANFIAALDADMIPERDWLRALLPHMLQDPKLCMTCPPQQFYNVPVNDPLSQSLNTFIHISEPIKDAVGVAWCTGSGYIMRRDALDSIGQFPLGSLAEDVCTSSMLLGEGWKTAYIHEPLQWGTVPDSFSGHLKQRTRWTIGTIQTSLKLRFCLFGPLVKHMTILQRLSGFVYTISSIFTILLVLSLFTIPIVLISGGQLIPYRTEKDLAWLIRFCWMAMISNRINEIVTYLPSGYNTGKADERGGTWMSPYHALAVVQSFILPKWLGGKVAVFTSTGSHSSELNERDPQLRAPLWRRLIVTLWHYKVWMHLVYIMFVLASIGLSTYHCIHDASNDTPRKKALYFLTHAGWPPVLWLASIISCWQPIQYAISPPTMPDREDLLVRDEKNGVAYPKEEWKAPKNSVWNLLHELEYSTVTAYTTFLFVISFII